MSGTEDLRETTRVTDAVKKLAYRMFGFREYLVHPLEADATDPSRYCLFEVCSVTYRVERGVISVADEEE